jgi:hypothetical protein
MLYAPGTLFLAKGVGQMFRPVLLASQAPYAVELYPACGGLRRRCSELSVYGCSLLLPCISLVAVTLWRKSSLHLLTLGSLPSLQQALVECLQGARED